MNIQQNSNIGLTALSLVVNARTGGWQQLLPAGYFSAVDGRPKDTPNGKWYLNRLYAERLIALAQSSVNELVIDYEHQTLNAERNGQPAPAAGWFKSEIEWREGSGLWIRPRWTPKALNFIRQGEYRYLSAVFPYEKSTGAPLALHSAALVNRPGLDGMKAVEALKATQNLGIQSVGNLTAPNAALSADCAPVTPEESELAFRYGMTEQQYLAKRSAYCLRKGTTWAALTSLTTEDLRVIRLCGQDTQSFQKSKTKLLAEDIVLNYIG